MGRGKIRSIPLSPKVTHVEGAISTGEPPVFATTYRSGNNANQTPNGKRGGFRNWRSLPNSER